MTRGIDKKAKRCKMQLFLPGTGVPAEFKHYPYQVIPVDCPLNIDESEAKGLILTAPRHDNALVWAERAAEYFNHPGQVKTHNSSLEEKGGFSPNLFAIFPKSMDAQVYGVAPRPLCHPRSLGAFIRFIKKGSPRQSASHHPQIDIRRLIFCPEGNITERMVLLSALRNVAGKDLKMIGVTEDTVREEIVLEIANFGLLPHIKRVHVFEPATTRSRLKNMIDAGVTSISTTAPFLVADKGRRLPDRLDGPAVGSWKTEGYERLESIRHNVRVILNNIMEIERS